MKVTCNICGEENTKTSLKCKHCGARLPIMPEEVVIPATNGSNAYGEYGIKIIDKAGDTNVLGTNYFVKPYALYKGTYYYYNETTTVTITDNTVQ